MPSTNGAGVAPALADGRGGRLAGQRVGGAAIHSGGGMLSSPRASADGGVNGDASGVGGAGDKIPRSAGDVSAEGVKVTALPAQSMDWPMASEDTTESEDTADVAVGVTSGVGGAGDKVRRLVPAAFPRQGGAQRGPTTAKAYR